MRQRYQRIVCGPEDDALELITAENLNVRQVALEDVVVGNIRPGARLGVYPPERLP